jgi:hypothetical protein
MFPVSEWSNMYIRELLFQDSIKSVGSLSLSLSLSLSHSLSLSLSHKMYVKGEG